MRLFLQLDIMDWQKRSYHQPLTQLASSLASDMVSADLDSQSEPSVVDVVIKLIDQSEKVFVWINAEPGLPMGSSVKLLHRLLDVREKVYRVVLSGKNDGVEKMVAPFQEKLKVIKDDEAGKNELETFAKS